MEKLQYFIHFQGEVFEQGTAIDFDKMINAAWIGDQDGNLAEVFDLGDGSVPRVPDEGFSTLEAARSWLMEAVPGTKLTDKY